MGVYHAAAAVNQGWQSDLASQYLWGRLLLLGGPTWLPELLLVCCLSCFRGFCCNIVMVGAAAAGDDPHVPVAHLQWRAGGMRAH